MAHATYNGEVWTDAHGFAAVVLPKDADAELKVDVTALADGVSAELVAEPTRRRFTITTSEPHVKVAWRASTKAAHVDSREKEAR